MSNELTIKHELFCQAYVRLGGNGQRAYMEVYGVSEEVARANASKLLVNANVRNRIATLSGMAMDKTLLTVEKVLKGIELGIELALAMKPKPDLRSYSKFLEMQGKYLKMFTDRLEIDLTTKTDQELLRELKDLTEQIPHDFD
jgi:hypothetical protein